MAKVPKIITPKVARDLAKIIHDHHAAIAALLYGKDAVAPEEWKTAVGLGLVDPDDPKGLAGELHTFGAILAHMEQAKHHERYGTTLEELKAEIEENLVPQTETEHQAAQFMLDKGAQYIVGLGNKNGHVLISKLQEQDDDLAARMRGAIKDVIAAKFGDNDAQERLKKLGADQGLGEEFYEGAFRETVGGMVSDVGHATKDWARDIKRIVQTESHSAIQEGMRESWEAQEEKRAEEHGEPPKKLLAFKLTRGDACSHCDRLHTQDGAPRIYYLDEITGNGTNVGRKAHEWKVVVGATHPHCYCTLHKVPRMLEMPPSWRSGDAAPSVIGPGGAIM